MRCDNGELNYRAAVSAGHHFHKAMRTGLFFALNMNNWLHNFRFYPSSPTTSKVPVCQRPTCEDLF